MPQTILLKLLLLKQCTLSSQRTLVWADLCKRACLSYRLDWQQDVTLFFPRGYIFKKQREWLLVYLVELQIVSCSWLKEQKKFTQNVFLVHTQTVLYLKWLRFLCNFTAWLRIKMTCIKLTFYQNDRLPRENATYTNVHFTVICISMNMYFI